MKFPVEVHKIIKCVKYSTVSSLSSGGVDDYRLSFVQYVQNYFQYVCILEIVLDILDKR